LEGKRGSPMTLAEIRIIKILVDAALEA